MQIVSENLGTTLLTGPGAGSLATANSVMNDIVSEVRNLAHLSQIFDELGIEIQELKQIEDRTIVITKAITRRQL